MIYTQQLTNGHLLSWNSVKCNYLSCRVLYLICNDTTHHKFQTLQETVIENVENTPETTEMTNKCLNV